jgi:hypothetical protein
MSLNGLQSITVGVPDVAAVQAFYSQFGLEFAAPGRGATTDGGEQLQLVPSSQRRLIEVRVGVDDRDDVDRIAARLENLGAERSVTDCDVSVIDPGTGVRFVAEIAAPVVEQSVPASPVNGPGRVERSDARAPAVHRQSGVRPRRLGHVVVGSVDNERTQRLLVDGLGFKVSDAIKDRGAFLRCSTDHHNVLVQGAPAPFLHHTAWQVEDVDEIGRGAMHMLETDPDRHAWGPGRHYLGSNYFWYLRDPAGNFAEYYSDLDVIVDDALWQPTVSEGVHGLYSWGPTPPSWFLEPEDIVAEIVAS